MRKILGVILSLGFLYRIAFLGRPQLWTDELMQALALRTDSVAGLFANLKRGMALASPLDYLVQKGFVMAFGETPWALRLHAALFGSLSIWLFYRIGRTLFGRRVAAYAAALFAIYPLHQHYSQEGRPHALMVFLCLASYDLLLRIVARRSGKERAVLWALMLAVDVLLLYTSVFGVALLAAQAAGLIVTSLSAKGTGAADPEIPPDSAAPQRSDVLGFVAVAALAFVLYIPWLWYAWSKPGAVAHSELLSPRVLLVIVKGIGDDSYPAAALILGGVAVGIHALKLHGRARALGWLVAWTAAYIPVVWALDLWTGYFFATRQLVAATPPLLLLVGYGLSHVGERLSMLDAFPYQLSSPAQVYVAALLVVSLALAQAHWRKVPADWAGTAQYLKQELHEGDELSAPMIAPLLEFHAPSLWNFGSADLDPGPDSVLGGNVRRRVVVCFNGMTPDPCGSFRASATKNRAWSRREMQGFTVFSREVR